MVGRSLRWAIRWIKRPKNAIAAFIFLIGVPGYREDIVTWIGWGRDAIATVIPRVQGIKLEPMAEVLASPYAPWAALGLALFVLNINKVRPILKWLSGRTKYIVATTLNESHFISESDAINMTIRSKWAKSRKSLHEKGRSIFDTLDVLTVDPGRQERASMYRDWCKMAIDTFEDEQKDSVRVEGEKKEYDEVALNKWLSERYSDDLLVQFGEP